MGLDLPNVRIELWWAEPDSDRRPLARKANVLTRLDDRPTRMFDKRTALVNIRILFLEDAIYIFLFANKMNFHKPVQKVLDNDELVGRVSIFRPARDFVNNPRSFINKSSMETGVLSQIALKLSSTFTAEAC